MSSMPAKELLRFIQDSPTCYHVTENIRKKLLENGYAELSDAERDVCRALATGMTPRQYAEQTGRALSTIETHRKNIYKKTDIHKAQHLQICYALMLRDPQ